MEKWTWIGSSYRHQQLMIWIWCHSIWNAGNVVKLKIVNFGEIWFKYWKRWMNSVRNSILFNFIWNFLILFYHRTFIFCRSISNKTYLWDNMKLTFTSQFIRWLLFSASKLSHLESIPSIPFYRSRIFQWHQSQSTFFQLCEGTDWSVLRFTLFSPKPP